MEKIGHKLRNIRLINNFTQSYVADKIGISQSSYARYEKKDKIEGELLSKIAKDVYETDMETLLNYPTDPNIIIHNISDNQNVFTSQGDVTIHNRLSKEELEDFAQAIVTIVTEVLNKKKQ